MQAVHRNTVGSIIELDLGGFDVFDRTFEVRKIFQNSLLLFEKFWEYITQLIQASDLVF